MSSVSSFPQDLTTEVNLREKIQESDFPRNFVWFSLAIPDAIAHKSPKRFCMTGDPTALPDPPRVANAAGLFCSSPLKKWRRVQLASQQMQPRSRQILKSTESES